MSIKHFVIKPFLTISLAVVGLSGFILSHINNVTITAAAIGCVELPVGVHSGHKLNAKCNEAIRTPSLPNMFQTSLPSKSKIKLQHHFYEEVWRNIVASATLVAGMALANQTARHRMRANTLIVKKPCIKRNAMQAAISRKSTSGDVGVILLSSGTGKRMGADIPKQYLKLLGQEIALRSLDVFLDCDVSQITIVCADGWRSLFQAHLNARGDVRPKINYAIGGAERQDSVRNGLKQITTEFVAVHDAARPLVTKAEVDKVIADAHEYGAAVLAVQTKATIKQVKNEGALLVSTTPDRKTLWEASTPQVVRTDLLRQGFQKITEEGLAVTDDVSLVECLGKPVKLTQGEYTNIKVTTPEDMVVAEAILRNRGDAGLTV